MESTSSAVVAPRRVNGTSFTFEVRGVYAVSDPDTLFQTRLPQLDTEIGLYAQTASPDPSVTTIIERGMVWAAR